MNDSRPIPQVETTHFSAKWNVFILALAQAVNGSVSIIAVSLGALAGAYLLHPDHLALATLPVAMRAVGTALFAMPVAMMCKRMGRKYGFSTGAAIGIVGGVLSCYALMQEQFTMFCAGFFLIGCAGAFVQQYRFAAADQGSDKFKSRAISWVLTGGVLSAFIGPQIALQTKDALLPTPFAGAFIALAGLLIFGIVILLFLKPIENTTTTTVENTAPSRPLLEIIKQPLFFVSLLCAVSSFALMTFVMTGAPLAMTHHGHSEAHAIIGIQWHVLAMYAPSFVTGMLIVRFGKIPMIALGLGLLILCAVVALSGLELWNFWTSLILLGLGWNFSFIGSTALLGESYAPHEKNTIQGLHDTILFSVVAIAALSSGAILDAFGWHTIVYMPIPIASISLAALFWLSLHRRKNATP